MAARAVAARAVAFLLFLWWTAWVSVVTTVSASAGFLFSTLGISFSSSSD